MYGYIYRGYIRNINMGVVSEVGFEEVQKTLQAERRLPKAE